MSKFPKQERLNSQKRISFLVTRGNSLYAYPFRVLWCLEESAHHAFHMEAAFSVPKRKHNKATRRNRIKRRMKEAFRLNKESFRQSCADGKQTLSLLFIYTPRQETDYRVMEKGMQETFRQLRRLF